MTKDELIVEAQYGKTHHIKKIMGTEVNLGHLQDNQSVCFGDGKTYHWLLTKKEIMPTITGDVL